MKMVKIVKGASEGCDMLGYGLSSLFSHDYTHHWSVVLYHKVVPYTLMVNPQPSFGYGLLLSLVLIPLLELCQLANFGYLAYSLPFT